MPRRIAVVLALLAVPACVADPGEPATETTSKAVTVCPAGPTVQGIDVSTYQGNIDWAAVKAGGIQFAIIRTSDGLDYPDSKFAQNWAGAKQAGVIRGVYQFFEPGQDPIAQADMMLQAMGPLEPGDLPPVIDVETTGGRTAAQIAAEVQQWLEHVAAATGRTPIIYSGKYFWNDNVGSADLTQYPLWIPQYGPVCPDLPSPWTQWAFFQYSSTGNVAGISTGATDLDTWNGDLASLEAFGMETVACGDGTCSATEDADNCPADCPPCGVVDASGGVIDETDACFVGGGPAASLRAVDGTGWDDDLIWTHTTSDASEANFGQWNLFLAEAGHYRVEVYTAASYAQSKQAAYQVRHAGTTDTVTIDQTAVDGWQTLGEYDFAAGSAGQAVHVGDDTGEPLADNVQLVFDAVRLTRLDPGGGDGSGSGSGDGSGDGSNDLPNGAGPGDVSAGCAAGGGGAAPLPLILALGALLARRRRRA